MPCKSRASKFYSNSIVPTGLGVISISTRLIPLTSLVILAENAKIRAEKNGGAPITVAVGDGNHSLATAKASWQEIKATLTEEEAKRIRDDGAKQAETMKKEALIRIPEKKQKKMQ